MEVVAIGKLAGLILAHSALIGSDQDGQPIAPYAIYQSGENRELVNYPSESSQEHAVAEMQIRIQENQDLVTEWASAQEGYAVSENGEEFDIYLIKIWSAGLNEPLKLYQIFNPKPFKLIGTITIMNYKETGLKENEWNTLNQAIDEGINSHPTASDKWKSWF